MKAARTVIALTALCMASAHAETSFGVKAGTLGLGLEGVYSFSDDWAVRFGFNQFEYDFDDDVDDVTYDGDLDLSSFGLLVDFRPGGGGFRLTGGAIFNGNEILAVADPAPTYALGNDVYTQAEVGVLSADVGFDSVAPYLGIGYDFSLGQSWLLYLDLGAAFQGEPDPTIRSTGGTLSDDPGLAADIAIEQESFEDDLDGFDIYPVASIGFAYRFR